MDEAQAVERWQRGDPEGLEVLVRAYELRALRTAYLILRDRMDAEDAVQNAFLRAWEHRHRFDPRRPFWHWLLRLVIREALRLAGRRDRHLPASSPSFLEMEDPLESTWGDPHPSPEQMAEQAEQRRRVWQALGLLSPTQRTAIVLRYYHELPEKEIAELMGCTTGTVKHYLYEGRIRLRGILGSPGAPDRKGEDHG